MLAATKRGFWRPAHIHMIVGKTGYERLVTHIFDAATPQLDGAPVFGVKPALVRTFEQSAPDDPEMPEGVSGPRYSVENDLVLAPAGRKSLGGSS